MCVCVCVYVCVCVCVCVCVSVCVCKCVYWGRYGRDGVYVETLFVPLFLKHIAVERLFSNVLPAVTIMMIMRETDRQTETQTDTDRQTD